MFELANDINGDPVEVPEAARFWRLRRHLGGRGASVVVTTEDNAALLLPIGASYAEFHEAVRGGAGKYTLYPCDEHRRPIRGAAVAHIFLSDTPRNGNGATHAGGDAVGQLIALLRETVEANTAMCKEVIGKYAGTINSNAVLVRAVTEAHLPVRTAAPAAPDEDEIEVDDGDEDEPSMVDVAIKQASDAFLMWLKARSENDTAAADTPMSEPGAIDTPKRAAEAPKKQPVGVPTTGQLAHLFLVKSRLEPREAKIVDAAIAKIPAEERGTWIVELCSRSVEDAVALVREIIAKTRGDGRGG